MLTKAIAAVGIILLGILVYAAFQPDSFRVERTVVIKAPPEKIYPLINDFRQWTHWSPWEKIDPDLKRTYRGNESGKGAIYEWKGNDTVGTGRMEIIDPVSPTKIVIDLTFIKPMEARNVAEFILQPMGADGTSVTWSMHGQNPFIAKLIQVFFSMDKMVGGDFAKGLDSLKAVAEK